MLPCRAAVGKLLTVSPIYVRTGQIERPILKYIFAVCFSRERAARSLRFFYIAACFSS
jgi:hypothetical protein